MSSNGSFQPSRQNKDTQEGRKVGRSIDSSFSLQRLSENPSGQGSTDPMLNQSYGGFRDAGEGPLDRISRRRKRPSRFVVQDRNPELSSLSSLSANGELIHAPRRTTRLNREQMMLLRSLQDSTPDFVSSDIGELFRYGWNCGVLWKASRPGLSSDVATPGDLRKKVENHDPVPATREEVMNYAMRTRSNINLNTFHPRKQRILVKRKKVSEGEEEEEKEEEGD